MPLSNQLSKHQDQLILLSRLMLMLLFLLSGMAKLSDFSGTVGYMSAMGVALPKLAAVFAMTVEILGSVAIIAGIRTRPIALLFILYTFLTAMIGHHFWTE